MSFQPPTNEKIREVLLRAPHFHWPTFDHMPLNCFDLSSALLSFPGDISKERSRADSIYVDYQIDINDLTTCPQTDHYLDIDLWNDESLIARWLLGRITWACSADADGYVLHQGFFSIGISITRFQNMAGVSDISDLGQLRYAIYKSAALSEDDSVSFTKEVNGRTWVVLRTLNEMQYPTYKIASPIDHRNAIYLSVTLDNCWFASEVIPEEVEQKHLASLWDYLAHINLHPVHDSELEIGTVAREAPGQAEKMDDELPEW